MSGPAARPECDHHWTFHIFGGSSVGICTLCGDPNWADLRRQRDAFTAQAIRVAAREQRNEAENVPDTDEGTHADGHRCAAEWLDRRAAALEPDPPDRDKP